MGSMTVVTTATKAHSRIAVSVPSGRARPLVCGGTPPKQFKENPPGGLQQPRELFFVVQVECQVGSLGEDSGLNSHLWLGWHRAPDG